MLEGHPETTPVLPPHSRPREGRGEVPRLHGPRPRAEAPHHRARRRRAEASSTSSRRRASSRARRAPRGPVGIIIVSDPTGDAHERDRAGLGLVARATGDVLETLQLSRGSYLIAERIATDDLTGVLNRGPFFERFATRCARRTATGGRSRSR